MEIRLEIYRELRTPRYYSFMDEGNDDFLVSRWPFGFSSALLRVNKKLNAEAKMVFYDENTYVTVIDIGDPSVGYDVVFEDRLHRHAMLHNVKAAHVHLRMTGELVLQSSTENGSRPSYIRNSMKALCQEFAAAPSLKSLRLSVRDDIERQSFVPDDFWAEGLMTAEELDELPYCLWDALGDLINLPVRISLDLAGEIMIFDKTDT